MQEYPRVRVFAVCSLCISSFFPSVPLQENIVEVEHSELSYFMCCASFQHVLKDKLFIEHTDTDNLSETEGSAVCKCAQATTKACCGERDTAQYWDTPFAEHCMCLFLLTPELKSQHQGKQSHFALTYCRQSPDTGQATAFTFNSCRL